VAPGRSVVISPRHHVTCKNGSKGAKYMRYRNGNDDHRNLVATPSVTSARITLVISMSCLLSAWARGCCPFIPKIFQSLSREASHGSRTSVAGRGAKHEWCSTSTATEISFLLQSRLSRRLYPLPVPPPPHTRIRIRRISALATGTRTPLGRSELRSDRS